MHEFSLAEIIGWLALTTLAGAVVWSSRQPADGAPSRLSDWISVLARTATPTITHSPSFDRTCRYGALGIWGIGSLLLVTSYLFGERGVARYEIVSMVPGQELHLNVYLTNRGGLNDIQWRGGASVSQNLKPQMADIVFDDIYRSFSDLPGNSVGGFDIQRHDANSWLSADGPYLDQRMIDSFTSGSNRSRMYVALIFRQKSPLSKQWTYTESCVELRTNGETTPCEGGHNRTYAESEIDGDCNAKFPRLMADLNKALAADPKIVATNNGPQVTTEELHKVYHAYFPIEKCRIEDVMAVAKTSPFFVKSWEAQDKYFSAFSSGSRPGYDVTIDIDKRTGDFAQPYMRPNSYAMHPKLGAATPITP